MKTSYFSFGQAHTHSCNGHTLDKNCLVKITAEKPREVMTEQYGALSMMKFLIYNFSREVFTI